MENALEVDGLTVRFGRTEVLKNLSFTLEKGKALAVIGPTAGRWYVDVSSGVSPKHFVRGEWFVGIALLTGIVWVICDAAGLNTWWSAGIALVIGYVLRVTALYRGWEEPLAMPGQEPPPPFRAPTAAPAQPANPPKPAESLVMELRGDHWVRLTSYGPMDIPGQSGEAQSGAAHAKGTVASQAAQRQC